MLNTNPPDSIDGVSRLGIAIKEIDAGGSLHAGILYRRENQGLRFLHFRTNHQLIDSSPSDDYHWVISGLNPRNQKIIAELCKDISLKNAEGQTLIPYGFRFTGDYFDPSGKFIGHPIDNGLTCATFILAVFRTFNFELLDTNRWPKAGDVEDQYFQYAITASMLIDGPTRTAITNQHGSPRFRPEHVVAGGQSNRIPLSYEAAVRLGKKIIEDMQKARAKKVVPPKPS